MFVTETGKFDIETASVPHTQHINNMSSQAQWQLQDIFSSLADQRAVEAPAGSSCDPDFILTDAVVKRAGGNVRTDGGARQQAFRGPAVQCLPQHLGSVLLQALCEDLPQLADVLLHRPGEP